MDRFQGTQAAFGHGMAFVGRQLRFAVGDEVMVVDLPLFHLTQLRYVVVELKIGRFSPTYVGRLGPHVAVVDDRVRVHAPTFRTAAVHQSRRAGGPLRPGQRANVPLAVATYETLTPEQRRQLPDLDRLQ